MNKEDIIDKILTIPRDFHARNNVSFYTLVKQSGYFEISDRIRARDFESHLRLQPAAVIEWLQWSEDKRSLGWYFKETERSEFAVGYLPAKENILESIYYDRVEACAYYIKNELEDLKAS